MKKLFENIEKIKESDLKLAFNKKINLKERYFFNHLLDKAKQEKKLTLEINNTFFLESLKEINIDRFLKLFFEKKIILKNSKDEILGIFNLISCFLINENKYIFFISETIYDYLTDNNNLILKYKLEILLRFENINIENLFFYILISLKTNPELILTKKEIKSILKLEKEYSRFFDLETKFIFPTLVLIKELCKLEINYLKIKGTKAINSKISYLKFSLPSENLLEENKQILSLLKKYTLKEETKLFTLQLVIKKSFNYVLENIYYFIDHSKNNFDDFLIQCLKFDFANTYFKNLLNSKLKDTKIITNYTNNFNSIKDFEKKLKELILKNSSNEIKEIILLHTTLKEIVTDNYNKMAKNKNNNFLYDHNELLLQLENIYINKNFYYEDTSSIFLGEFNSFKESYIYILQKENFVDSYLSNNKKN